MAEIKKIQPMGSSTQYDLDALHVLYDGGRIASPSAMNADNRLHIYLSTSSMTTDKPPSGDGHILHFGWDNAAGWSNQLAIGNTGHLAVRGGNGNGDGTANTQDWKSWYTVLDSNNYNNYAPTKTGGGASGTWGINITGSAASCTGNAASTTKLQTARTIWGQSFNGTANITGQMTNVGPNMYLPSGQSAFSFLTSGGGAGNGKFGRLLLSDNYSTGDISSYRLDVYGGSARIYNGYLYITANSNTVTIGSQNTSFCHITNSADIPFWFNKEVQSAVAFKIYDSSTRMSDGSVTIRSKSNPSGNSRGHGISLWEDGEGGNITIYTGNCGTYGSWQWDIDAFNGDLRFFSWDSSGNYHGTIVIDKNSGVLRGACWNDYAEFRATCINAKPGQCVIENGDDTLSLSTKRCQSGAQIVSDTYGFAIGEVEGKYETPLAVSGRVLAYTDVDRYKFKPGQAVCSGPNGTISRMRWYEKILWPERMIGFVSAIPEYEEWGNINAEVKVDNRIWIKVR